MNSLHIELIEKIDYDDFDRMWVRLTCGSEVREVCYEPTTDGYWSYLDGENEPLMPPTIERTWNGKAGDDILTSIWNGDFTHTVIE